MSVITKDKDGWERIVFAEVIVPNVPNVYGDFHTEESVRQFAYSFMINGFTWDVNHDNGDWGQKIFMVESFIARENDPDFIKGAWVVGCHIADDALWEEVLNGNITGYSYEAWVSFIQTELLGTYENTKYGNTEKAVGDGHRHRFFVVLDEHGRVITGSTDIVDGHYHSISQHTVTDPSLNHVHLFQVV